MIATSPKKGNSLRVLHITAFLVLALNPAPGAQGSWLSSFFSKLTGGTPSNVYTGKSEKRPGPKTATWAVADTDAAVGKVFKYSIPEAEDSTDGQSYRVTLSNGQDLPDWLYYDSSHNTLYGVPDPADTDATVEIRVSELHGRQKRRQQQQQSRSADFRIRVRAAPSQTKSNAIGDYVVSRDHPEQYGAGNCSTDDNVIVATIVLDVPKDQLKTTEKVKLLYKASHLLHNNVLSYSIAAKRSAELVERASAHHSNNTDHNTTHHVTSRHPQHTATHGAGGSHGKPSTTHIHPTPTIHPGNTQHPSSTARERRDTLVVMSDSVSAHGDRPVTAISWVAGCDAVVLQQQLEEWGSSMVESGKLEEELGYPVLKFYFTGETYDHYMSEYLSEDPLTEELQSASAHVSAVNETVSATTVADLHASRSEKDVGGDSHLADIQPTRTAQPGHKTSAAGMDTITPSEHHHHHHSPTRSHVHTPTTRLPANVATRVVVATGTVNTGTASRTA